MANNTTQNGTLTVRNERQSNGANAATMFRREDWMEFRDPNRITNKAGVPYWKLPMVLTKELVDDALDASDDVEFGFLPNAEDRAITLFVADKGDGIPGTDEEIADLYSISRPLTSSKMLRLPTRGMLGNGLRVVAGIVLIAEGQLRVSTRGRTLTLQPQRDDGKTAIVDVEPWEGQGTHVAVTLRGELAEHVSDEDYDVFALAEEAKKLACGTSYKKGRSSAHWYDERGFWELCQAAGSENVGVFVNKNLEGCSGKAAKVAAELLDRPCDSLSLEESNALLARVRDMADAVSPKRLGKVGHRDDYFGYRHVTGEFTHQGATIPFVVEAWANRSDSPHVIVCVNRTPVCADINVYRCNKGSDYVVNGCQLRNRFKAGRKDAGEFSILLNIITPFTPLTTSGKSPDLTGMRREIIEAIKKAIGRAKRNTKKPGGKSPSQKSIIRAHIDAATEKLSGGGEYLFSLRQLFYELRPILIYAIGKEPNYKTFSAIVGEFEDEYGDIDSLYRDDRGSLYHPHTKETISLGTRSMADYQRPAFHFRSLLFCEKEGLFPQLEHAGFPEQFDCALCSCKGFATRAMRTLIRLVTESPEPITVFAIHDADGHGTVIYESMVRKLEAYEIEVVNLGLDPAEGREMGLTIEPVAPKNNERIRTGEYLPDEDKEWLQRNRIELNAMSTPQFIAWLTSKFNAYYEERSLFPKVIPPSEVLQTQLELDTRGAIEQRIVDKILKAANIPDKVAAEYAKVQDTLESLSAELAYSLAERLKETPIEHWTEIVKSEAQALANAHD